MINIPVDVGRCTSLAPLDVACDRDAALRLLAEGGYLTLVGLPAPLAPPEPSGARPWAVVDSEVSALDGDRHPLSTARSLWHYLSRCVPTAELVAPREERRPVRVAFGRAGPASRSRRAVRASAVCGWLVAHGQGSGVWVPERVGTDELLGALGCASLSVVRPSSGGGQRSWSSWGLPPWLDAALDAYQSADSVTDSPVDSGER